MKAGHLKKTIWHCGSCVQNLFRVRYNGKNRFDRLKMAAILKLYVTRESCWGSVSLTARDRGSRGFDSKLNEFSTISDLS